MDEAQIDQLIARLERVSDDDVIKALASPEDYTPEALAVYEAEAQHRGIRPEAVPPVAAEIAQTKKNALAATPTFRGIGERLYGCRRYRADGSYQATKWFIFLHVPVYPICSFRVRPESGGKVFVIDVLPIDRRQVLGTYCFVGLLLGMVALIGFIERHPFPLCDAVDAALLGLPFVGLYVLRRRARRRDLALDSLGSGAEPPVGHLGPL
jgi:hypothetical protein